MSRNTKPISVIQWATGAVGRLNIATCKQNSAFKLVGCYVHSPAKHGLDAGEIAGVGPMNVKATNKIDDILKMEADVVIYSPLFDNVDEICQLLESGKNVVTPVGYTSVRDEAVKAKLEAACRKGNSSFHGSGIHPGFAGDRLPLILSGLSRRIDKITVYEIVDMSKVNESWDMVKVLGFDMSAEEAARTPPAFMALMGRVFFESINLVAQGLGIEIEEYGKSHEFALAKHDIHISFESGTKTGTIKKGQVAGQHFNYFGKVGGKKVIDFQTYWKMAKDLEPSWPYDDALAYKVIIDGEPPLRLDLDCGVGEGTPQYGLYATAINCMNTAPLVVKAAPGIVTQLDLPMIRAVNAFNLGS